MTEKNESGHKRILQGVVTSDKMQKTIVVKVDRRVKHDQYEKYLMVTKKYKAHDEAGTAKIGDRVEIVESRPVSAEKRWALRKVIERASL